MANEKKSSNKIIIILLMIIILLLIGGGVTAFVLLNNSGTGDDLPSTTTTSGRQIPLEVNAGVMSPDALKNWNESALKEAEDTQIPVSFAPTATSADGENFLCQIGNPAGAKYYMYLDLYSDTTLSEEIYLSGLLEPGKAITSFKTSKKFPKGETDTVLVLTTVQEDRQTIVAQTMVVLTLAVS